MCIITYDANSVTQESAYDSPAPAPTPCDYGYGDDSQRYENAATWTLGPLFVFPGSVAASVPAMDLPARRPVAIPASLPSGKAVPSRQAVLPSVRTQRGGDSRASLSSSKAEVQQEDPEERGAYSWLAAWAPRRSQGALKAHQIRHHHHQRQEMKGGWKELSRIFAGCNKRGATRGEQQASALR